MSLVFLYYVLDQLAGVSIPLADGGLGLYFFPSAILLIAALWPVFSLRRLGWLSVAYMAGVIVVTLVRKDSLPVEMLMGALQICEVGLIARLTIAGLDKRGHYPSSKLSVAFLSMIVVTPLVFGLAANAMAGLLSYSAIDAVHLANWSGRNGVMCWWLSHAAAYGSIGLLGVFMANNIGADPERSLSVRRAESLGYTVAQASLLMVTFSGPDLADTTGTYRHHPGLMLLVAPFLIVSAFRLGLLATLPLIALSGYLAGQLSANDIGPFSRSHGMDDPNDLRLLIALATICGVLVAAFAERMHELVEAARRANEAKTRFLASAGHELRSSLNGVIGAAELLQLELPREADPDDRLGLVRRSSALLQRLVEDMLEYSKIDRHGVRLKTVVFQLPAVAEDVANMFREEARDKGLELRVEINMDEGLWLRADEARIRQVMINLISNACKFTDEGWILLTVRAKPLADGRVNCVIEVTDTGVGVPAHMKQEVFHAFAKSDDAAGGGLGLGLAISQDIALAMGGSLTVHDRAGGGAMFCFRFSAMVAPSAHIPSGTDKSLRADDVSHADRAMRRASVLVAEDNASNQIVLEAMLRAAGLNVTLVANGAEAVDALKSSTFDLVLLDRNMPVLNGDAALSEIRALPGAAGATPILIVSGEGDEKDEARLLALGAQGMLIKPLTAVRLIGAVSDLLSDRNPS